jgi:hypothetical protein
VWEFVTQPVTAPWLVFAGAVLLVSVVCWAAGWATARTGRQPDAARVRLDEFTPPARPAVVGRVPVGPASLWPPPATPEMVEPRATAVMPAVPAADATVRRSPLLARALGDLDQIRADAVTLAQLPPPPPPPSLDGAYDVLPTDDDPDGPDGDDSPPDGPTPPAPPPAPELEPARYAAVLGARYEWGPATQPAAWELGVMPRPLLRLAAQALAQTAAGRADTRPTATARLATAGWALATRAVGVLPLPLLAGLVLAGLGMARLGRAVRGAAGARWETVRGWAALYLARWRHGQHEAGNGQGWLEGEVHRRLAAEREAARLQARWLVAQRTGATWGRQLALMRRALTPPAHTPAPAIPWQGCTP